MPTKLMTIAIALVAFFPLALTAAETSHDAQPSHIYRVEYSVRELRNGKVANTRNYVVMVQTGSRAAWGSFRAGNEVPFYTENGTSEHGESGKIEYRNVGISVRCMMTQSPEGLTLTTEFTASAAVTARSVMGVDSPTGNPVFRSTDLSDEAAVSLGKQFLVGRVDDVATDDTFEVEATVTEVR